MKQFIVKLSFLLYLFACMVLLPLYGQDNASQKQSPGLRATHCLVYDNKNQTVILLDGTYPAIQAASGFSEPWSWDGKNWKQISNSGPQARYTNSTVYDSKRKRIISYGGRIGKSEIISNELWEWDGMNWIKASDSTIGRRDHPMMAYDVERGKTIVFGGGKYPRTKTWSQDTWEWDGKKWELAHTAGPLGRVGNMVYDKKNKLVILFGGVGEPLSPNGEQPLYNDTWSWNGQVWNKLSDSGPPARSRFAMCYDDNLNAVVIYGGESMKQQLSDMWKWDGKNWTEIKLHGMSPGKRSLHAMVYDTFRRKIVLYGGNCEGKVVADTWEWDGVEWKEIK